MYCTREDLSNMFLLVLQATGFFSQACTPHKALNHILLNRDLSFQGFHQMADIKRKVILEVGW